MIQYIAFHAHTACAVQIELTIQDLQKQIELENLMALSLSYNFMRIPCCWPSCSGTVIISFPPLPFLFWLEGIHNFWGSKDFVWDYIGLIISWDWILKEWHLFGICAACEESENCSFAGSSPTTLTKHYFMYESAAAVSNKLWSDKLTCTTPCLYITWSLISICYGCSSRLFCVHLRDSGSCQFFLFWNSFFFIVWLSFFLF